MSVQHVASPALARFLRLARWFAPVMGFLLIGAAIWVLQSLLRDYSYADVVGQLAAIPKSAVVLAAALTVVAYGVLIGYDLLALAYVGRTLPFSKVALGSFVAHAMSHSLGFHMITAGTIRFRFWSAWGLPSADIARALGFASSSFLMGLLLVCGVVLLFEPAATMALLHLPSIPLRILGGVLVVAVLGAQLWVRFSRHPLRVFGVEIELPRARLAVGHLLVAASDWTIAASVAYVLLPHGEGLGLLTFTGAFLLALIIAAIGHVPGGVGVFETLLVLMLKPYLAPPQVLGPLIVYRVIYYVLPFVVGLALMLVHEVAQQGSKVARVASAAVQWLPDATPFALGTAVFAMGTVLLLLSATPLDTARMVAFGEVIPLPVIELAHFAASCLGITLLGTAWFLRCRLQRAFVVVAVALALAAVASILRGLVWQVATLDVLVLAGLLVSARLFNRTAPLASEPLPIVWSAGVLTVLAGTAWLGFFTFKDYSYSSDLWLQMSASGDLARFLRATAGAALLLLGMGVTRRIARARAPAMAVRE